MDSFIATVFFHEFIAPSVNTFDILLGHGGFGYQNNTDINNKNV